MGGRRDEKKNNGCRRHPAIKMALELGPVVLFFAGYMKLRDQTVTLWGNDYSGFLVMTAAFIAMMILTKGMLWWLTGKLSKIQIATVILVVVFGGLSLWFKDERFFKMKPTIIYLLFGGILGFGLLRGQSYLKLVMEKALPLQAAGWMILTRRLCAFFFALAIVNEAIWRNFSTETWVNFKTFGLTAMLFLFFTTQGNVLKRYAIEEEKKG